MSNVEGVNPIANKAYNGMRASEITLNHGVGKNDILSQQVGRSNEPNNKKVA